jgi:nucleoside 2-deoxyribosyltransferase
MSQAHDWRDEMIQLLAAANPNFYGVSPLRCEPLPEDLARYTPDYPDQRFGTPAAIASKNRFDVRRCDVLVAYLPKWQADEAGHDSVGTQQELGWAVEAGTERIVITDIPHIRQSAVIRATCPWIFGEEHGFQEAVDVIAGIWEIYA